MNAPAEELRAAAKVLRETASKATPGPWTFDPELYLDRGAIMSMSPDVQGWDVLVMDVHSDLQRDNARWSALAHPGIAEPLADWLDAVAGGWELATSFGPKARELHPGLHLARAINGSAS